MIEGFEEYTKNVSDNELEVINLIARSLEKRIGIKNAITNANIRIGLYNFAGISINSAKVRRYIQYIRAHRLVSMLCASKKGYYIAKNLEEWIKYRESFRSRVRSMNFTIACMDLDAVENNVL